jgi:hypothetical protein
MAASSAPGGDLSQPVHVNISRDGEYAHPVYSRVVQPGGSLNDLVVLDGDAEDAFYMLRVTRGAFSTSPDDTLLWSSPIWVDAESSLGYPRPKILPATGTIATGTPFTLLLSVSDPQGLSNLADLKLHLTLDGKYVGALPLSLLIGVFLPSYSSGGVTLSLPLQSLPVAEWGLVLEVADKQGHQAVAGSTLIVLP